jgi:iron(III) transport system permease protein
LSDNGRGLARLPAAISLTGAWRQSDAKGWLAASGAVALFVLAPIAALALIAAQGSGDLWPHLVRYVLPQATLTTAALLLGVGAIVIVVGAGSAWLVTAYAFPGSKILDWALLLPLAVPTYVVAFAYLDILHPIGPLQSAIRAALGIDDPRTLSLPDIRSLGGCTLLLGFVLYPYVYLSTRAMFLMQAASLLDAARVLGADGRRVFRRIALPLARPAIAVGTSLALLEALNDIGAAEFLGVRTLTVSIYATWINRSSLPGAAQIALLMLAIVGALVLLERRARRHQRYAAAARHTRRMTPQRLSGPRAAAALLLGFAPIVVGFALPAGYLVSATVKRLDFAGLSASIVTATANTIAVALIATLVTIVLGLCLAYTMRLAPGAASRFLAGAASLGYAVPGTVLAVGLLTPLATIDNALDALMRSLAGLPTGLLLTGSGAAVIYAYVARFLAIASGGIDAGLSRIPPSVDDAARNLGGRARDIVRRIHLPLVQPALLAAGLLVFVDCMKELPATLLLRPLNFETLATHLYAEASRGTYEDGAVAALLIVLFGLIPVVLLAKVSRMPQRSAALPVELAAVAAP